MTDPTPIPAEPEDDNLPDDVGDDDLDLEVEQRPNNDGPADRDAESQDPEATS